MKKISLQKTIQNLQFMSQLWIAQKTELTKKPKFTSSRKMLILKNGSKFASKTRRFTVDALVQNEQLVQRSIHAACKTHVAYNLIQ